MRRYYVRLAVGLLTAAAALPPTAAAQGFGIFEHGSCVMGRAGTGVASPCADGSSIFFNPAGIAFGTGQVLSAGSTFIVPKGGFEADAGGTMDLDHKIFPVPAAYYTRQMGDRFGVGIGVFAPYGLETNWPADGLGRFLGYKSVVQSIYIQPTAAVRVGDRLALGAGADFTYMKVELRQRVDLSEQFLPGSTTLTFANVGVPTGTDFADVKLSGDAWNVGFHVGAQLRATDRLSFGIRYLSRQKVEVSDGTLETGQVSTGIILAAGNPFGVPAGTPLDSVVAPQFRPDSALSDQSASTAITLPDQIVVGTAFQVTPKLTVLFDYQWTNWKLFDQLVIDARFAPTTTLIEDYRGTDGFRFGAEYAVSPVTTVRAGYLTHSAASPDKTVTPNLPEGKRAEFTAGLGTRLADRIHVDLAYQYIDQADRRGRVLSGANTGLYDFKAHLFGATFVYAF